MYRKLCTQYLFLNLINLLLNLLFFIIGITVFLLYNFELFSGLFYFVLIVNIFFYSLYNNKNKHKKLFWFEKKELYCLFLSYLNLYFVKIKNFTFFFFANAWYVDSLSYRLISIVYFFSLNITYYVIDKGFIYNFGAEGFPFLLMLLSKMFSILQSGSIIDYLMLIISFIAVFFCCIPFGT